MNPKHDVEIVGRRLEVTDALRAKVQEVADKLYEHDGRIDRIKVELEMERHATTHHNEFIAKGQVDDGKDHFIASAEGDDLYAAIGELGSKLDRLVRRKSRLKVSKRRRARGIELAADLPKAKREVA